jgi:hypothetical protein
MAKSEIEVALEMYQSVMQANDKQRRLRSSTFWGLFGVKSRRVSVVERIATMLDNQNLRVVVKSGTKFGEEDDVDWIVLTPKLLPEPEVPSDMILPSEWPSVEWFETIKTRIFESEREVEAYFISPMLEKLGYEYDDISIGYAVEMFKGVQKTKTEADFVLFDGSTRTKDNTLLVVEAKKGDKGISTDHLGQVKSYAQELIPACYMLTNGNQVIIYQFNGMLIPDERIMDFDRVDLQEKWGAFYGYVSKQATIQRKKWMQGQISKAKAKASLL